MHDDIERLARKRAAAKLGWFIHAIVFILVNLLLAAIAAMQGRSWAVYPAFGWALGLAIHGLVVFVFTGGAGLHERMIQRERERLALQRDPW